MCGTLGADFGSISTADLFPFLTPFLSPILRVYLVKEGVWVVVSQFLKLEVELLIVMMPKNMCYDRSLEVKLPTLGNYRTNNRPTMHTNREYLY